MTLSLGKKIAGAAVAGLVLVGAGTAAWAAGSGGSSSNPSTPAVAATPAAAQSKAAGRAGRILRRADHGTLEIKVKGTNGAAATWKTFTFDRGKVSAVSASQITLARPDGQSVTLQIGPGTTYRGVTSWQQIMTAKGAIVISQNGTATIIAQSSKTAAPASGTAPTTAPTTAPAA
ncbi:MAG TPA: hypothetical protein VHT30_12815 [Acidimicrobiales bacterium]|jgi:hypothetical protein|nr:hypothetical protein [Acidimicrobiales bacterium]